MVAEIIVHVPGGIPAGDPGPSEEHIFVGQIAGTIGFQQRSAIQSIPIHFRVGPALADALAVSIIVVRVTATHRADAVFGIVRIAVGPAGSVYRLTIRSSKAFSSSNRDLGMRILPLLRHILVGAAYLHLRATMSSLEPTVALPS